MSETADYTISATGHRYVDQWKKAVERVRRAESELTSARNDRDEASKQLAKWMLPRDAKPGEKICVWFGDELIQVEALVSGEGIVSVRTRGKRS